MTRDNETVKFEATTEVKLTQAFTDIGRMATVLEKMDLRLHNIEAWQWKIVGGVMATSAIVSFFVTFLAK